MIHLKLHFSPTRRIQPALLLNNHMISSNEPKFCPVHQIQSHSKTTKTISLKPVARVSLWQQTSQTTTVLRFCATRKPSLRHRPSWSQVLPVIMFATSWEDNCIGIKMDASPVGDGWVAWLHVPRNQGPKRLPAFPAENHNVIMFGAPMDMCVLLKAKRTRVQGCYIE